MQFRQLLLMQTYTNKNAWLKRLCLISLVLISQISYALGFFANNRAFDLIYSGDVYNLLPLLKQYDPGLIILPPLGKIHNYAVSVNLQDTNLTNVSTTLANQTHQGASLIYDPKRNTIRLNYVSVLDVGTSAIRESLKWQKGMSPKPILRRDGVVRFPYGEYEPVVTCQPLNLCDIELQAGEAIQGIVIGDSINWNQGDNGIPVIYSGLAPNKVPHLVLKPVADGLETSLVVTTSKRTYMLRLKSSATGYVARSGFYYPDELINQFEQSKAQLRSKAGVSANLETNESNLATPVINLNNIHYNYSIEKNHYSWSPLRAFDDGVSVYIQMPDNIDARNLPGICVLIAGDRHHKKCEMVNFRYNDHFYIVDQLFEKAKLINGFDNTAQTIMISHINPKKSFWQRLFRR